MPDEGEEILWLDEDGICRFTGPAARMPSGAYIGSGETDILELVTGIVWNKPGPGFEVFDWDISQGKPPEEVSDRAIGLKMDVETIKEIMKEGPDAILLARAGGDLQQDMITPDEWKEEFGTNGMAALARMRFFRFVHGGGVHVG